jgi:Flp pilus assembly pilin Flp
MGRLAYLEVGTDTYPVIRKTIREMAVTMLTYWNRLRETDVGASMVEYALLVTLIVMVALVAVALAGNEVSTHYSHIASAVSA